MAAGVAVVDTGAAGVWGAAGAEVETGGGAAEGGGVAGPRTGFSVSSELTMTRLSFEDDLSFSALPLSLRGESTAAPLAWAFSSAAVVVSDLFVGLAEALTETHSSVRGLMRSSASEGDPLLVAMRMGGAGLVVEEDFASDRMLLLLFRLGREFLDGEELVCAVGEVNE